jgi:hypothetical protein
MVISMGLYYPLINFKDDAWLKSTALYWDRMGRIVPSGFHPHDSAAVKELQQHGYIDDYRPGEGDLIAAGKPFFELVATSGEALRSRYGVKSTTRSLLSHVFYPKLEYRLASVLRSQGLAIFDGARVLMHPRLVAVYMTALADIMAQNRQLSPLTDGVTSHLAVAGLTTPRLAAILLDEPAIARRQPQEAEVAAWMAGIAFSYVLPASIESVPVQQIIEFRERYPEERATFQSYITSLVLELEGLDEIEDRDAIRHHLEVTHEKLIAPRLNELERKLRLSHIDTMYSVVNVQTTAPPAFAAALGMTGLADPLVLTGVGLAVGLWGVLRKATAHRSELATSSPVSYLYRARRDLDPGKVAKEMIDRTANLPLALR